MTVGEVKTLAGEWLALRGEEYPDLVGAHLLGSIVGRAKDELFPDYLDVDLSLVMDLPIPPEPFSLPYPGYIKENVEVSYKGLMLELVFFSEVIYSSAEVVLANQALAPYLRCEDIIHDPQGRLQRLAAVVGERYTESTWVTARTEAEKALVAGTLQKLRSANSPASAAFFMGWLGVYLSGLMAAAKCRKPTHRRSLILLKEILSEADQGELFESILEIMGYRNVSRSEATTFLNYAGELFDYAVQVKKTPAPFDFKITTHTRPYLIDSSRAMIDSGSWRESMFWILAVCVVSFGIISNDGTNETRLTCAEKLNHLIDRTGFASMERWSSRCDDAEDLVNRTISLADRLVTG